MREVAYETPSGGRLNSIRVTSKHVIDDEYFYECFEFTDEGWVIAKLDWLAFINLTDAVGTLAQENKQLKARIAELKKGMIPK